MTYNVATQFVDAGYDMHPSKVAAEVIEGLNALPEPAPPKEGTLKRKLYDLRRANERELNWKVRTAADSALRRIVREIEAQPSTPLKKEPKGKDLKKTCE